MNIRSLPQLVRMGWGMPRYVRRPLTGEAAAESVRRRMEAREGNFPAVAETLIFNHPASPYRKLLQWAGCEPGDLRGSIRRHGIERTLQDLRERGVYVTLEEFRGKIPICRPGLTIETDVSSFDNPALTGASIPGSTSGTRSGGVPVLYTWALFSEEAATERLLLETHGLADAPLAMWMPGPPGIAGIHNLLIHLGFGRPPARWFSQVGLPSFAGAPLTRLGLHFIGLCARSAGMPVPGPQLASLEAGATVARWMRDACADAGTAVLKTFASSAVRLLQAAKSAEIDLSGCVVFTGGEPLTERRYRYLRSGGLRVFPRYAATEAGIIGGACDRGERHDEVHLYLDRFAVIEGAESTAVDEDLGVIHSLLFTSLSLTTPKVLLNAELGDWGRLGRRRCGCRFGQVGMDVLLSSLTSPEKLTGEGMTVLGSALTDVISRLVEQVGGAPDDYQLWESFDDCGLTRLSVAVNPDLGPLDESSFLRDVRAGLGRVLDGGSLAADIWQQADTLQVVRARPRLTAGHKYLPIVRHPDGRDTQP